MSKKILIIGVVILSLATIGGGVFYWWEGKQPKDILPSGVRVEKINDNKLLINEPKEYELEYPKNLVVRENERTKGIDLFNPKALEEDCFECPSDISVVVIKNPNSTLEDWLEEKNKSYGFMYWDQREKVNINGYEGYKIEVEGGPGSYDYYFSKRDNIYLISTLQDINFVEVVKTIVFK